MFPKNVSQLLLVLSREVLSDEKLLIKSISFDELFCTLIFKIKKNWRWLSKYINKYFKSKWIQMNLFTSTSSHVTTEAQNFKLKNALKIWTNI